MYLENEVHFGKRETVPSGSGDKSANDVEGGIDTSGIVTITK